MKDFLNWNESAKNFRNFLIFEKGLANHSVEAYTADLGKLIFFLEQRFPDALPHTVQKKELAEFLNWLNKLGLGARTQARILSGVKAFFKYLLIDEVIDTDPAEHLESPRLERYLPDVLSYEEIQEIMKSVDLSHPQGIRNRAILETLYACGLRVSELTNLQISNLYLDIGFVKVTGKGDKERLIPIGDTAVKYILQYLQHIRTKDHPVQKGFNDHLFLNRRGRALSRVMIFMIVKEAANTAGIEKNVSPHTFRHSFATHLVEGGADLKAVQDMLGHESITTTEIYTHLDTEYLRETVLMYHPRNKRF